VSHFCRPSRGSFLALLLFPMAVATGHPAERDRRYAACLGVTSPALYSSTVSRLRRSFPPDRFFLVMVRLLKRRRFPPPGDGRA